MPDESSHAVTLEALTHVADVPELFRRVAEGGSLGDGSDAALLAAFGLSELASPAHALDPDLRSVLRAAGHLTRLFRLPAPDAPGLAFVGGTVAPASYGLDPNIYPASSVSGRGFAPRPAFLGCIGEAVEHLSRLEWGDETFDGRGRAPPRNMGAESAAALVAALAPDEEADWLPARRVCDGAETAVPAGLCLVRRSGSSRPPSSGCAAGATFDDACLAGLLELVERDAAALWWHGGRPAKPLAAEVLSIALGARIADLRQGAAERATWILDITTDVEISTIAAVSVDPDGFGLACGLAARPSVTEAARAAFLELCQMELANRLVALKLHRAGEGALAPVEQRHRRRMTKVDANEDRRLTAKGAPRPHRDEPAPGSARGQIAWAAERLARVGIEAFAVDLTRPMVGIPAVRVVAPMLQTLPAVSRTARLTQAMVQHRSPPYDSSDIDLI
ncbi:MAG TPA: YcaO-like family protein [Beijerinckiaceae bacterium]|jgi:ribosomal protein S12 methylthiotransferase accessory factor